MKDRKVRYLECVELLVLCILLFLSSCGKEIIVKDKIENAQYEIMEEGEFPEKISIIIEEKKQNEIKMVYKDNEYLYIIRGYGKKATGGYSIAVKQLYLSRNALVFESELIGPAKGEKVIEKSSYPCIVIKTGYLDKNVVFE